VKICCMSKNNNTKVNTYFNPILFEICTSKFSKLCKNLHSVMKKSVPL
jgi:hypothetical protein